MHYVNTPHSCLETASTDYQNQHAAHFTAHREIGEFLFTGHKVTRFLPALSVAAVGCTIATTYIVMKVFTDYEGGVFAKCYKNMPDLAKNYLSFKTAKIIAIIAAPIMSSAVFSSAVLAQFIGLLILIPLVTLRAYFDYTKTDDQKKQNDACFFSKPIDSHAINKLNDALNNSNEAEAIKLVHQLYPGDIRGDFYNKKNSLLWKATLGGRKKLVQELLKGEYFTKKQINEAFRGALNMRHIDIMDCLMAKGAEITAEQFKKAFDSASVSLVRFFMEKGFTLKKAYPNKTVEGLFFDAASYGHIDLLLFLAEKENLSLNIQNSINGFTALHYIANVPSNALLSDIEALTWPLILKGADPTLLNNEGKSFFTEIIFKYNLEGEAFKAKCLTHYLNSLMLLKEVMAKEGVDALPFELAPQIYLPWINLANPEELL